MTVLLTRPAGQNEGVARAFLQKGIQSISCPVFSIQLIDSFDPKTQDLLRLSDVFIVTSVQALSVLEAVSPESAFYVVGARTAEALHQKGCKNILYVAQTAEELLQKILGKNTFPQRVVFLSGDKVSVDFSEALGAHGISCERVIVYETRPFDAAFEGAVPQIRSGEITHITVLSNYTAERIITLFDLHDVMDHISSITCLAFSENIKNTLQKVPWKKVWVSPEPTLKMFCSLGAEMILKEERTCLRND